MAHIGNNSSFRSGPSGNDDEESDVDVGQDPNDDDNISKRVNRVKKAYESHHLAKLSLACHVEMYKGIPDLIKDTTCRVWSCQGRCSQKTEPAEREIGMVLQTSRCQNLHRQLGSEALAHSSRERHGCDEGKVDEWSDQRREGELGFIQQPHRCQRTLLRISSSLPHLYEA